MRDLMTLNSFVNDFAYYEVGTSTLYIRPFTCVYGLLNGNASWQELYPTLWEWISSHVTVGVSGSTTANHPLFLYIDDEYMVNSGEKWISRLLYTLYEKYKDNTTSTKEWICTQMMNQIGIKLIQKFGQKWEKLMVAFNEEYNPIHNYDMTEDENYNTNVKTTNNSDDYVNGFNSSAKAPNGGNETVVTTKGSSDENKRHLERSGNIGVTTTQQMLQQEIELRRYNIQEQMFQDIDSVLTLSVY